MNTGFSLLVILMALVGSAFYAGMETGVVSINHLRLRHLVRRRVRGADILQRFLRQPDHLLGTTLVGNNLCNVIASVLSVSLGARLFGLPGYWVAYALLTVITLLFCEYLPKAWFQAAPAPRTLPLAGLLHLNGRLFHPFSRLVMTLTRFLVPLPTHKEIWQPAMTRDEFSHLTRESTLGGSLTSTEGRMMHGVLTLSEKTCRDIMVPREQFEFVPADAGTQRILERARSGKHTRLPVFSAEEDRFIGIVYVFDVLADPEATDKCARDFMRPPQFVDHHQHADKILPRMRRSRQPLALVTDDRSRVVGLVTTEDVLEEIVGPLEG